MYKRILLKKNLSWGFSSQKQTSKAFMHNWNSVVGLEVHAQLLTDSKLFSGSNNSFGTPLNSAVSYFDASLPGTLPVLNRKCVELGVKTATALNCRINEISMFDRKHYFYADLPVGYQITQQRAALANDGELTFPVIIPGKKTYHKKARLLQLQLEQDSGKSLHDEELKRSLVDLNRAGAPLIELVFAPDLETGEEAASLVKELILILKCLQSCSCKMEEGALRVDANVSIHRSGEPFGVRTEIKNIGSVRSISQAITYEIQRQLDIVSKGGVITNETRAWDAAERCTVAMRDKEVLQDYRFMPEPNLPPLRLNLTTTADSLNEDLISVASISKELPELPEDIRSNLVKKYQLNQDTAVILVNETRLLQYFLNVMEHLPNIPAKLVTNFLINDLLTFCNKANIDIESCQLTYTLLEDILTALNAGTINLQAGRQLIEILHEDPTQNVQLVIKDRNLEQITDDETIEELCRQAIERHEQAVKQYKSGKKKAIFAIVGEVSKLSKQRANMKVVVACLENMLKS
ncbi:glutamyl-tRNA(Gln) amidotransferase subunit B, mitochondrial isoform X1 [Anastrepha obliqua]|uniref:glutamyl-tRNA(Gln) amidotransferase subunit B, mitochondrial isoform X1 n=1 Tax=Anastrepha obliqua TaxID=95512 RepID=UPI002409687B|nr:glutamyl-tRNA(Gln) amidotransferase subunit B, mitochondrial isoform X1 [Anastrepha obliqua]